MACWCGTNCSGCGGCSYTCSGCSGGCQGSCKGGCQGSCKGGCQTACNTGCTSTESSTLANTVLNDKMNASNIQDIAKLIYLEAKRRGQTGQDITFQNSKIQASQITSMISNLSLAGQSITETTSNTTKVQKSLGQQLLDKALAAYETTIGLS